MGPARRTQRTQRRALAARQESVLGGEAHVGMDGNGVWRLLVAFLLCSFVRHLVCCSASCLFHLAVITPKRIVAFVGQERRQEHPHRRGEVQRAAGEDLRADCRKGTELHQSAHGAAQSVRVVCEFCCCEIVPCSLSFSSSLFVLLLSALRFRISWSRLIVPTQAHLTVSLPVSGRTDPAHKVRGARAVRRSFCAVIVKRQVSGIRDRSFFSGFAHIVIVIFLCSQSLPSRSTTIRRESNKWPSAPT